MNSNRVILLTGGSGGVGRKIAVEFARSGYRIAFTYASDEEGAKATVDEVKKYGIRAKYYLLDVSDYSAVQEVMNRVLDCFGTIDVLINNAGIIDASLIKNTSLDSWQKVIDVNLTGVFNCIKSVIEVMEKQQYGRIITIGSIAADRGSLGAASYAASKAGIVGLTRTVAREVAGKGITANVVSLGYMDQGITARLPEKLQKKIIQEIPSGKFGDMVKAAKMVVFLASEEAEYINGQSIRICGGAYM
ncbi:MAG: SDR family oxidoreductase [Dehalobacterium sp.]